MPTPDEIRRYETGSESLLASPLTAAGRQRPQLACPDEIPTTLLQWRQSVANNHESSLPRDARLLSSLADAIPPTDSKLAENQSGSDCSRDQISIPSPTGSIDQKFSLHNSVTSLTSSSDLPESHSPLSLSHEYSTTRVRDTLFDLWTLLSNMFTPNTSFYHQYHAHSFGLGLASWESKAAAHSSMKSRLTLSMSIWANLSYVDTFVSKVRMLQNYYCYLILTYRFPRPYWQSSNSNYILWGRNDWTKVLFPNSSSRMGSNWENRLSALGQIPRIQIHFATSKEARLHLQKFCREGIYLHALERIFPGPWPPRAPNIWSIVRGILLCLLPSIDRKRLRNLLSY